jgi:TetR/AcrR family transcriptional regulator, cholesterol catabolism regulator
MALGRFVPHYPCLVEAASLNADSSQPGSTGEARADGRRRQIIAQAVRLFATVGYHRTSVEQIASAADLAKPSLYHYFRSKEDILNGIYMELQEKFEPAFEAAAQAPTASECITAALVAIMDLMDTAPGYLRVFFEYQEELTGPNKRRQAVRRQSTFDFFRGVTEAGIASGEFKAIDSSLFAAACLGLSSTAYQWYRPHGRRTAADIARNFAAFLLQGVKAGD